MSAVGVKYISPKFIATICVLPMAFPCILTALPFALATMVVDMWERANK